MTARTRLFGAVLVVFGLAAGCTAVGRPIDSEPSRAPASARRDDKSRKGSSDSKTAKSDDDANDKDSDADSSRDGNPFRRREDKVKRAAAEREDDSWMDSDSPGTKGDRSRSESSSLGRRPGDLSTSARSGDRRTGMLASLDPETRELVDTELRESTPDERRELEHDLAGLDPRLVRAIITMHRMARQKDQPPSDRLADGRGQRSRSEGWSDGDGANDLRDEPPGRQGRRSPPANDGRSTASQDRSSDSPGRNSDSRAALSSNDPWGRGSASSQSPSGWGAAEGTGPPDFGGAPSSRPNGMPSRPGANYGGSSAANTPTATGPFAYASPAGPAANDDRFRNPPPARLSDRVSGSFPSGIVPAAKTAGDRWDVSSDPQNGSPAGAQNASIVRAGYDQAVSPGMSVPQDRRMASNAPAGAAFPLDRPQNPNLAPNSPPMNVPAGASDRYAEELQRLIGAAESDAARARLTQESSDSDRRRYIEKQVDLRMLYMMAGQQERALQAIPGIDAPDQEFWQQMFWAVANYFDGQNMPNRSDRATQTAAQLRTAIHRLQETARLELHNVAFCHEITSYGSYQRFPRDEFSRGQPVLVYAEVNNFKSVPAADGQNLTRLRSTVEIYTPAGGLVDRIAFPEQEDVCRNQRHDYFLSHQFHMPNADKIQLGPHVMKLIVEDLLSQKVAEYSVNFTVK